jgi:hypothetical protein
MCRSAHIRRAAAGPIVAQHAAEQGLSNATPPVRGIDIQVRAPSCAYRVHAPHPADNLFACKRHILRNGASSPSSCVAMGRVRVIFPSRAARDGCLQAREDHAIGVERSLAFAEKTPRKHQNQQRAACQRQPSA